jgi:hypothetical protein
MSFIDTQKYCESRFAANFTALPIAWQNVEFEPTPDIAYVEFGVFEADSIAVALSDVLYRNVGTISVNIYVPLNTGLQTAKGYADSVKTIFAGQTFNSITCRAASVTTLGEVDGWHVTNVSVPYFWDSE